MIDIEQATKIVLEGKVDFGMEQVPIREAAGRILAEPLVADRDFPPFDRVTMDGIAFVHATLTGKKANGQPLLFPVLGIQAAGSPAQSLPDTTGCMEVMTGAVLPAGCDTVVRYEDVTIENGVASLVDKAIRQGQNIHRQGTDRRAGSRIINPGKQLTAAELGVAATVGKAMISVKRLPKAVIISTGNELVPVDQTPAPHQIRSSNMYTIRTTLEKWGVEVANKHLVDDADIIRQELQACLDQYDMILLSGGVSKGKFDFVPQVLADLGVQKFFHRVKQRPGKPFWFGQWHAQCTVFALPGNPVSSFMCTHRYVGPWLRACLGMEPLLYDYAVLDAPFSFKPALTYFLQVKLDYIRDGRLCAVPVEGHGSGDLANLVDADGFLELPMDRTDFPEGELFPVIKYR
ncbi:MAG: molybdopterin molybdotransferase MoeA [Saprospiraceae bacterium]|nr:molybdopterin molybdotransferase MoeA [Saprospiraceae bacterium]